ncbi:hypothetical protein REPUB_Repub12eG0079700 [Reevesia pubescens]
MRMIEMNESRIAITTDMWTADHQKKGYLALTAHFIDSSWTLQKRIIRYCYVPAPHTKEVIADELMKIFLDWNLDRKLSTITLDNCSVNDGVVDLLVDRLGLNSLMLEGNFFHIRCCAHILNLIVKDGLDVIGDATPKRIEKFEDSARQLRIPTSKKLSLDCKTRWNSTYLMLQTALLYKDVFSRTKLREPLCKILPTDEDWNMAKVISEKLQIFYNVTETFSGTKYPTANFYFSKICEIKLALSKWRFDSNMTLALMASRMLEKFEKYWSVIHGIMGVATVLDPRYKKCMLEYYFSKIYGVDCDEEINRIDKICRNLLREYEKKFQDVGVETNIFSCTSIEKRITDDYDEYVSRKKSKRTEVKTEFDFYLEEDVLLRSTDFDILQWWKSGGLKYPMLQRIARDVFAIPVSTVASESTFSIGGRLIDPHRSRLHPIMVEALTYPCSTSTSTEIFSTSSYGDEDDDDSITLDLEDELT